MRYRRIPGDGNCLFTAIAIGYQISAGNVRPFQRLTPARMRRDSKFMRELAVASSCTLNDAEALNFMTSRERRHYCRTMKKDGVYGGEVEIAVLSEALRIPIYVYSRETRRLISKYNERKYRRAHVPPIRLLYSPASLHYDLILPVR